MEGRAKYTANRKLHGDYLRSPEWRAKRDAVLRRDGYMCQACLQNQAVQVHHKTYRHWGNEPLFDLVAVCEICHDEITKMDREYREGKRYFGELPY